MALNKLAFVIMPIKRPGTEEHQHFRALYDEVLKPTLESAGFVVQRADDIQKAGAISRDIILHLAEADLVVADLTDLNPNVYYELGVRHALRGTGTVMVLDELRTTDIPFDLSAYRVIKFKGELFGIGRLRSELLTYANQLDVAVAETRRDNPVHDWLPVLPINSLEAASGTTEGKLREQLATANDIIRQYEKMAGTLPGQTKSSEKSPLEIIMAARQDAEDGNLASDMIESARLSVDRRDRKGFLSIVQRLVERPSFEIDAQEYALLSSMATHVGTGQDVANAILTLGLTLHPHSIELRTRKLSQLAHSTDGNDRKRAREELARFIGIEITPTEVSVPDEIVDDETLRLLGIMLDTYHTEGLHIEGLRIVEAFSKKFPNSSVVCRNMGRALRRSGDIQNCWAWYKRAILTPDATDIAAVWYGSSLHNERRNVDALEAFLVGAKLDPNDGTNFAHVADELSYAWVQKVTKNSKGRQIPEGVDIRAELRQFVLAAFSCRSIDADCISQCRTAAERAEIDISDLEHALSNSFSFEPSTGQQAQTLNSTRRLSLADRVQIVTNLYQRLGSEVTLPEQAG
jgi:hypothetical protein